MNTDLATFRLSPQQEAALALGARSRPAQCAVMLRGRLDPAWLRSALEDLIDRHEILRTSMVRPAGVKVSRQLVHPHRPVTWSSVEAEGAEYELDALLAREASRPFNVAEGPLARAGLHGLTDDRHILLITAHAACADGESLVALVRQLADPGASEDPLQYADYAEWRHSMLEEDDDNRAAARFFWGGGELTWPRLRLLFGRATVSPDAASTRLRLALDAETSAAIDRAAASRGVSAAIFLEACWHSVAARLSGEEEITLGRTEHGRWQPDLEGAVGPYAQIVPVTTRHERGASLAELLDQISRSRSSAGLQDYAGAPELSAFAAQVGIGFAFAAAEVSEPVGGATAEVLALTQSPARLPLELAVRAADGGLAAELVWDPAAYDGDDIVTVSRSFLTLLRNAVADDSLPSGRLRITTDEERARLTAAAAGPPSPEPAAPVHLLFDAQARRSPSRVAVRAGEEVLTYAELHAAASHVAAQLDELAIGPGQCVGVCMDRSPAMIAAVLGIMSAGSAYLPLNLDHPAARLSHQLAETNAAALVTQTALSGMLPGFAGPVLCVDGAKPDASQPSVRPATTPGEDDLAYVMYTSGSTGLPKGAAITHRNLGTYTQGILERLGTGDAGEETAMCFATVSAISTDLGNTCVFPALTSGGCLDLISAEVAMDPDSLGAHAAAHPYDVLKITPSHLQTLLAEEPAPAGILPRRCLVLGGEALRWPLVERVRGLAPDIRILNHYGPTETTIGCCAYDIDAADAGTTDSATVPIGRALPGDRVDVLDRDLEPVPVGVPGQLCVGGSGVARGYVGRPEETAERFVPDPFSPVTGERMYLTGDRVRRLRDDNIEFLGRFDDQLKIRGHRVEPGEIEEALLRHPAVRQAAVTVGEVNTGAEPRLVAYVVAFPMPTVEELRAAVAAWLPDHMMPSAFVALDALPFTASGKIDRRALTEPEIADAASDYVAPRDDLEEEIAGVWAELLKVERVSVHDDFFALGGHSLLATQAIMKIRRRHGEVSLRALLAAPTVAALADAIRSA